MHTDPSSISPTDVLHRLARANAPVMLDLRLAEDVAEHPVRLPASRAVPYLDIDTQRRLASARGAICICHKGKKISHGVAARLRAEGIDAVVLEGGVVGWQGLRLPVVGPSERDLLVLPHGATAPEMIGAWAHSRFSLPWAAVLRIPREEVPGVLDRFDAVVPGPLDAFATDPRLMQMSAMAEGDVMAAICAGAADTAQSFACCDAIFRGLPA
ncbi:MAG: hypothetical protein AAF376_15315 [Pseudomonadota bacterium]